MKMHGSHDVTTPEDYIAAVDEARREQIATIHAFIRATVPDLEPFIQSGMLAYGHYRYRYASGREGDWCRVALASNKQYISLYCCAADSEGYVAERFRERLPKANIGKSCVRFKRWSDLDHDVVAEMLRLTAVTEFGM